MQKIYPDAAAALEGLLFDGMTICAGGFGLCGIPERLIDAIQASVFVPDANAGLLHRGGLASVEVRVPNDPAVFGATLTTQWLEWSQQASSNAIEWTVANAAPGLGMALLEGHPQEASGHLTVHLAHVLRFESQ